MWSLFNILSFRRLAQVDSTTYSLTLLPHCFCRLSPNGMKTNIYNIYTCSGFVYSVVKRGRGGQDGLEWDCWTSARKALSVCVLCVCFFVRLSKRQSDFRNRGYLALKGIFLAYTWWNNNSGSDSGNTNSYTPYTHRHQAPVKYQIGEKVTMQIFCVLN